MDIVTQGLLGAALAQTTARSRSAPDIAEVRVATLVGALAGMAPDVDALLRSQTDPLLFLDYHRHFTHALVFIPLGAAIVALVLAPFLGRRLGFGRLYLYAFSGYVLAGLLDACTSYGTHLFWPFMDRATSWHIIAIVDPVFSLILLIAVVWSFLKRRRASAWIGLSCCAGYLLLAGWQQHQALTSATTLASSRNHAPVHHIVKPTIGNIILWRSVYQWDGQIYADAIRVAPFAQAKTYAGESAPLLTQTALKGDALPDPALERFARFSEGWLVSHPTRSGLVGDARFSMLPTDLIPLWGIEPDPGHISGFRFVTDRTLSRTDRERFTHMLFGRTPTQQ